MAVTERPNLDSPTSALVLFTRGDNSWLAESGYYPLPQLAQLWIRGQLHRHRFAKRVRRELAEIAAAVVALEQGGRP